MSVCLIVEDNRISRQVLEYHVANAGLEHRSAGNGAEALSLCREQMPDVIVLDWHMPQMDGLSFLSALRKLPGGDRPVVVMCTCDDIDALIYEVQKIGGANGFLPKPTYGDMFRKEMERLRLVPQAAA